MDDLQPQAGPGSGRTLSAASLAVVAGRPPDHPGNPVTAPLVMSSTYHARDGRTAPGDPVYGRSANDTWTAFETAVGALEHGTALVFASGMGAISAVVDLVPVGGLVVIPESPYSGTTALVTDLADRGRLRMRTVDTTDTTATCGAVADADLVFLESPTNPLLDVADLAAIGAAAHTSGTLVAVDNTFATPLLQQPLLLGADIVVHSATKLLSGHSDVLLGVTVANDPELIDRLHRHRTSMGAIPGPFETWLALRGLRTLAVRVERACANAAELARRLQDHPAVAVVRHPSLPSDPAHRLATAQMSGFGSLVRVDVRGGAGAAEHVCSAVRLWVHATSLGGVESLIERRRRHAAESPAVPENSLRLSVGIEDVEDLWHDLDQALRAAHAG